MKFLLIVGILFNPLLIMAQSIPTGIFQHYTDIGNPAVKGSTTYHTNDQSYQIKGGGYNIWFNRDEFQYAYNKIKGDFILTANIKLLGEGKDPHRKIGWMIRASEQEDAAHISAVVHGDGLTVLQWRSLHGAYMRDPQDEIFSTKKNTQIIQLERMGKRYIMRIANAGEPLQELGRTDMVDMPDEVMAGLFICSHNPAQQEEGIAWNVRIEKPVADTHDGYRDGILGSKLELMNVQDGKRMVIYQDTGRLEAPNWMPDGKRILFNQGGNIYTIPVEGGMPQQLNTGVAKETTMIMSFLLMENYWASAAIERVCPAVVLPFIIYPLQVVSPYW